MGKCVICKEKVDWKFVCDEFEEILQQADHRGVESLTENEQVVWEGGCCSQECFDKL